MEDKRFAHIATDPKFRRIPKHERKVKIDKRFESMFNDKKFKQKYTVDKRGRPVNHTSNEDLKRYYELSSEADSESEQSDHDNQEPGKFVKAPPPDDSAPQIPDAIKTKLKNLKVDYARGESTLLSESSSDDESEEEEESDNEDIDHKWGELDNDAESTEAATYRLAACNMDWDRIRALDLMVLLSSFLPPGGAIKSVAIYPSEFGKQRMLEEETSGPMELVGALNRENDSEEGAKYHMEKLRKYQLNRLKYYYAVITCDSPASASKIYADCDGMEYESSATKIDLRFVPDEMGFDAAKELCDALPELDKYRPRFFTTTALQQAKVDLTWDETDPSRVEVSEKLSAGKIDDISESDLMNYLAVSSGDDDSEGEPVSEDDAANPIDKYKLLLQEIEAKEEEKRSKDVEMEVSWGVDLKERTEKLVKKKMDEKEQKTPFEKFLDKKKEKRKEKRKAKKESDADLPSDVDLEDAYFAEEFESEEFKKITKKKANDVEEEQDGGELELLLLNEEENGKGHFSLKQIQDREEGDSSKNKKKKKKMAAENQKDDGFQVNVDDERFSALFTSHLYNIDPTDPHYKKTKAMETLIGEKIKRRIDGDEPMEKKAKLGPKKDAELSVLVKSIKRKTQALNNRKK